MPSADFAMHPSCGTGFQPVRCGTGFQPVSATPLSKLPDHLASRFRSVFAVRTIAQAKACGSGGRRGFEAPSYVRLDASGMWAMTLSSTAIGVGRAPTSIVVRVG